MSLSLICMCSQGNKHLLSSKIDDLSKTADKTIFDSSSKVRSTFLHIEELVNDWRIVSSIATKILTNLVAGKNPAWNANKVKTCMKYM